MENTVEMSQNTLKYIRKELMYSRIYVGKEMKKSEACVERIETGKKKITLEEAASLSKIYKKTLDEIYIAIKNEEKLRMSQLGQ